MKRLLIPTLILGILVSGIVSLLHAYGVLFRAEFAIAEFVSHHSVVTRLVADRWQYLFVVVLAFGVTWMTLEGARRGWAWWLIAILLIELVGVSFVCALYHVFFQPLPSILVIALTPVFGYGYYLVARGSRARLAAEMFSAHLSPQQLDRLVGGDFALASPATAHEATVVVCDIANKHELAEDCAPETIARMLDRFVRFARDVFLKEGAYVESADGEGVVAIFGFPTDDAGHAEVAAGTALHLLEAFGELRKSASDLFENSKLHLGLSSGTIVAARLQNDHQPEIVPIGEPFELARRFCIANRVYGSCILMGPQTFGLAEKATIARPIDFLGGTTSRERLEIYELLSLAKTAKAEDVMRRDNFWNGVVYYREKRWEEAYAEFQKSWGENGHDDAPLQLYLRRLEPLVLHLAQSSSASELLPSP